MVSLLSRFQGALVGAVVGDCIGAEFEGLWIPGILIDKIIRLVDKIEAAGSKGSNNEETTEKTDDDQKKKKLWTFTDDTAMARSVARSLIEKKGFDGKHMAERFSEEYHKEPFRGYGSNVTLVFKLLKDCNYLDLYGPASRQFDGMGSYGNGGAMRICPLALYAYQFNDKQKLKTLSEQITKITHSHPQAIQGALLEVMAVDQALRTSGEINTDKFIDDLITQMKPIEEESRDDMIKIRKKRKLSKDYTPDDGDEGEPEPHPYCSKLEKIRRFVKQKEQPTAKEINDHLGTDIDALSSVPAAVYSFLRSTKDIEKLNGRNPFERTIMHSISQGGDTDTIATMAGAIAGACYGIEAIPQSWQNCCEGVMDALKYAEDLYKLNQDTEQDMNSQL